MTFQIEDAGWGSLARSGSRHLMACFCWVAEDLEKREKFVKAGWKSWQSKGHRVAKRRGTR